MKTLTVTAARQNLGAWLKKAVKGEDIGVMIDGAIVAFRPVKVYSEDYAVQEYGVTPEELDKFADAVGRELDADRKAGRSRKATVAKMPDIAARLKKVFGRKVISDAAMQKLWDESRGVY